MKTNTLILCIALTAFSAKTNATVRTLNNNNPTPGQYSTYNAVDVASAAGDTVYVSGSPNSYGQVIPTKQLTLIGTGHNPDKQNPLVSILLYSDCTIPTAAGSKFIGFSYTGVGGSFATVNNVTYENCYFADIAIEIQVGTSSGLTFNGCVFNTTSVTSIAVNANIITFNNCIFKTTAASSSVNLTIAVNNCLFLGNSVANCGFNIVNSSFNNNIFYGTSPQITGTNTGNTMTRNISYNCPNNNYNAATLTANLVNQNPQFVFYPAATGFHYTDDYHLLATSPAHNVGTDGKDLGIYGATYIFHMGGEPAIPQIRFESVSPLTVPAGQSINVNVISTRKQ